MSARAATRAGLAALAACSAVALVGFVPGVAPAAKEPTPWHLFPRATMDVGRPLLALGSEKGRVWVVTVSKDVPILHSARASGGSLTSFAETRVPADASVLFPLVDGELVLNGMKNAEGLFTARLLANGRLGAPSAVPDDLLARGQEVVPKLASVVIRDGVRVGDRTVWALGGAPDCHSIGGCPSFFLACCSESGAAVDLTRFIDRKTLMLFPHIGRDARGRIWFAWLDNRDYSRAARGVPRIIELDPSTLAPRSKAVAAPGLVADRVELACAASCRIVAQSIGGDIVSWAPGERSPTRVASHWERGKWGDSPAWLLAATYRSGDLVVAYHGSWGKTIYGDASVRNEIRVARGDTRGARARVVGAIPIANNWPPQNVSAIPTGPLIYATFAPNGLIVVETFQFTRGYYSPVAGAVIPFGR